MLPYTSRLKLCCFPVNFFSLFWSSQYFTPLQMLSQTLFLFVLHPLRLTEHTLDSLYTQGSKLDVNGHV